MTWEPCFVLKDAGALDRALSRAFCRRNSRKSGIYACLRIGAFESLWMEEVEGQTDRPSVEDEQLIESVEEGREDKGTCL